MKSFKFQDYLLHTAISRKVVGKNVHTTIPKGNTWDMIDAQFLMTVALKPTFVAFL